MPARTRSATCQSKRGDQRLRDRQQQELPERAGRGRQAHRQAAALRRDGAADDRQDDAERRAAERAAEQHRAIQVQQPRDVDVGKANQAQDVADRAGRDHAPGPVAVGEAAGERAERAPHQVLQRDGEGEHLAPPAVFEAHRLQEQAESGADAERDAHDDAAAGEDQRRRAKGLQIHARSLPARAPCRAGTVAMKKTHPRK